MAAPRVRLLPTQMDNLEHRLLEMEDPHTVMQRRLGCISMETLQTDVKFTNRPHKDSNPKEKLEDWAFKNLPFVSHAIAFLIYAIDLMFRSIPWFRFGCYTVELSFRLIVWAVMLLPVLLQFATAYFRDPRIRRRIRFGPSQREYLDIYVPEEALLAQNNKGPQVPVVVALMGGGFVIGHRSYNVQLGLACLEHAVMFVCIDYRNFPFATVPDMVENVTRGVKWVFENIEAFGGDLSNMVLVGQSAGAHLAAMALLEHCLMEAKHAKGATCAEGGEVTRACKEVDSWCAKSFKMFLGISGPYDLMKMTPHMGLPPRVVRKMTGGDPDACSPERLLASEEWQAVAQEAAARLPPIHLFHGADDHLVPSHSSVTFAGEMRKVGIDVTLDVREGINHTYPVIEGPMLRHDIQLEMILPVLLGKHTTSHFVSQARAPPRWPSRIVTLAARLSPFGPFYQ